MVFKVEIFQVWKIMEDDLRYGKVGKGMQSVTSLLIWKIKIFIALVIIPAFVTFLAFHEPKKQVLSFHTF